MTAFKLYHENLLQVANNFSVFWTRLNDNSIFRMNEMKWRLFQRTQIIFESISSRSFFGRQISFFVSSRLFDTFLSYEAMKNLECCLISRVNYINFHWHVWSSLTESHQITGRIWHQNQFWNVKNLQTYCGSPTSCNTRLLIVMVDNYCSDM